MKQFTVLDLIDKDLKEHNALDLTCIAGRRGLIREIEVPELNRPGLALSGFYESFAVDRIQIFGKGEHAYLEKLRREKKRENIETFFSYSLPCCIFTHNLQPSDYFLSLAEEAGCPVLQTQHASSEFSGRLMRALGDVFAEKKTIHGVLVEVSGIGILIQGDSGVGKSETALELIERGHRLVSDDAVEIRCVNGNILLGSGTNKVMGHHMEIRGLGIINVTQIFGVGSIRDKKQIQLVVELEEWDSEKVYERLGCHETTVDILGVKVPHIRIPVKPGRNIPILIETAAMNERLKSRGQNSAQEFNRNILKWLESENARALYLDNNLSNQSEM
ncbi:MAG: HPr(Ser) kinase/phosphatase [Spirochaetales bacterium]|nr:HPr(Ser) kinase/phosphatase [Spirochaetales bacterium]